MRAAIGALASRLRDRLQGDPIELARERNLDVVRRPLGHALACFVPKRRDRPAMLILDNPAPFPSLRVALALAAGHDLLEHRSVSVYVYDDQLRPIGIPLAEVSDVVAFVSAFLSQAPDELAA